MNIIERMNVDKLLVEAGAYFGGDGINYDRFEPRKFANLVAAQEREALKKIDWTALMREGSLVTRDDAQELGGRVIAAITARGTT